MNTNNQYTFICYPKCSTCKKAEEWLKQHTISYRMRDIKAEKPSFDEIKEIYQKSGLPLKRFFNTSGILYKEMKLKEKLGEMSEEEQLKLLASDGMLVKRPILVSKVGDRVLVGFKEIEWEDFFK